MKNNYLNKLLANNHSRYGSPEAAAEVKTAAALIAEAVAAAKADDVEADDDDDDDEADAATKAARKKNKAEEGEGRRGEALADVDKEAAKEAAKDAATKAARPDVFATLEKAYLYLWPTWKPKHKEARKAEKKATKATKATKKAEAFAATWTAEAAEGAEAFADVAEAFREAAAKAEANAEATKKAEAEAKADAKAKREAADVIAAAYENELLLASKLTAYGILRKIYGASGENRVRLAAIDVWTKDGSGDGKDLAQECARLLLIALEVAARTNRTLQTKYMKRVLSKKVYIRDEGSAAYKDEETCLMREVYAEARKYISNNRAVCADTKYIYTSEVVANDIDEEGNFSTWEKIYLRIPYAYAAAITCDISGRSGAATLSATTRGTLINKINGYARRMKLTEVQADVLRLRLRGYGMKAIGTYRGTSKQAVMKVRDQIQVKADKVGITEKMHKAKEADARRKELKKDVAIIFDCIDAAKRRAAFIDSLPEAEALAIKAAAAKHNAEAARTKAEAAEAEAAEAEAKAEAVADAEARKAADEARTKAEAAEVEALTKEAEARKAKKAAAKAKAANAKKAADARKLHNWIYKREARKAAEARKAKKEAAEAFRENFGEARKAAAKEAAEAFAATWTAEAAEGAEAFADVAEAFREAAAKAEAHKVRFTAEAAEAWKAEAEAARKATKEGHEARKAEAFADYSKLRSVADEVREAAKADAEARKAKAAKDKAKREEGIKNAIAKNAIHNAIYNPKRPRLPKPKSRNVDTKKNKKAKAVFFASKAKAEAFENTKAAAWLLLIDITDAKKAADVAARIERAKTYKDAAAALKEARKAADEARTFYPSVVLTSAEADAAEARARYIEAARLVKDFGSVAARIERAEAAAKRHAEKIPTAEAEAEAAEAAAKAAEAACPAAKKAAEAARKAAEAARTEAAEVAAIKAEAAARDAKFNAMKAGSVRLNKRLALEGTKANAEAAAKEAARLREAVALLSLVTVARTAADVAVMNEAAALLA